MLTANQNEEFKKLLPELLEKNLPLDEIAHWLKAEVPAGALYGDDLLKDLGYLCGSCGCAFDQCENCDDVHNECLTGDDIPQCGKCGDEFSCCERCDHKDD